MVLAVVLLAGCSSVTPSSEPTTPTVADVPADPPPGVSRLGDTDANRLASAHAAALRNESSYTLDRRYTERYANGTTRIELTESVAHDRSSQRFRYVQTLDGEPRLFPGRSTERYEQWSNGTLMVEAVTVRGADRSTHVLTGTNGEPVVYDVSSVVDVSRSWEIYALFVESNGTDVSRTSDGYRVEAVGMDPRTAAAVAPRFGVGQRGVTDAGGVTLEATIRPDGLVLSYELRYVATVDGEPVRATHRVDYSGLGTTSVPRPDWAQAAIDDWVDR